MENHKEKHSKEFGLNLSESYKQHAIKFANTVDKKNCKAYVDENGTTYKFNRKTNELAIVNNEGYIISYYTVSDKFYYKKGGEKIWINAKKK